MSVEDEMMAGLERAQDFGMGEVDALGITRRGVGIERKSGALFQQDAALAAELADAQLRALQVGEDADRTAELAFQPAQLRIH